MNYPTPIRFPYPEEGNDRFPLPPDYYELTADAQRQARVNGICLQERPTDLVFAWDFFRTHYLKSLPPG